MLKKSLLEEFGSAISSIKGTIHSFALSLHLLFADLVEKHLNLFIMDQHLHSPKRKVFLIMTIIYILFVSFAAQMIG